MSGAFDFVTKNRDLFNMPADLPFRLRPRLDAKKKYFPGRGEERVVRELIFKVPWGREEENPIGRLYPDSRLLTVGTTLAIAWDEPKIRARLTHQLTKDQSNDRTSFLREMIRSGTLIPARPVTSSIAPNRRVIGERSGSNMTVSGTGMMLHVAGPWAPADEGGQNG